MELHFDPGGPDTRFDTSPIRWWLRRRWLAAYDSTRLAALPEDLLALLPPAEPPRPCPVGERRASSRGQPSGVGHAGVRDPGRGGLRQAC